MNNGNDDSHDSRQSNSDNTWATNSSSYDHFMNIATTSYEHPNALSSFVRSHIGTVESNSLNDQSLVQYLMPNTDPVTSISVMQNIPSLTTSQTFPDSTEDLESISLQASINQSLSNADKQCDNRRLENVFGDGCVESMNKNKTLNRRQSVEDLEEYIDAATMQYNINQFWCEDCNKFFQEECILHSVVSVPDKQVDSKARATCPSQLVICKIQNTEEFGVFARRKINKRTRFGPFECEYEEFSSSSFQLPIEDVETKNTLYVHSNDESICNWMMFVRPASDYRLQNLVAFQQGGHIYYSAICDINNKEELQVWYSNPYALHWGFKILKPDIDMDNIKVDKKYKCFECSDSFDTPGKFEAHLTQHEAEDEQKETVKKKLSSKNKKARKKLDGDYSQSNWKKKRTTCYLTKFKQDAVKRSLKTIKGIQQQQEQKKKKNVCEKCNAKFDDVRILKIHEMSHKENSNDNIFEDEICENDKSPIPLDEVFKCPICDVVFNTQAFLIRHTSQHARVRLSNKPNRPKPFLCTTCGKKFTTIERLDSHKKLHNSQEIKLECKVCDKKLMNNSALACHMKTHSSEKFFDCPICNQRFDQVHDLRVHVQQHAVDGVYFCPKCPEKKFLEYIHIRKHMKAVHGEKSFHCTSCPKSFPRADKLRLHMLVHTDKKDFMCDQCGRQFKRKDKLKDHTQRVHDSDRKPKLKSSVVGNKTNRNNQSLSQPLLIANNNKNNNSNEINNDHEKSLSSSISSINTNNINSNKIPSTDYQRYTYKCDTCMVGFKRRGMLVNHLAKRHPQISIDDIPELTYPILKTQRDYFCQYCDKTYKSSSKRKVHIMRHHPGQELPPSGRHSTLDESDNPTFSTPVRSMSVAPHSCSFCHKQYASRAKLYQHQRKDHPQKNLAPPIQKKKSNINQENNDSSSNNQQLMPPLILQSDGSFLLPQQQYAALLHQSDNSNGEQVQYITFNNLSNNDLLQQAVCEAISPPPDNQRMGILQLQQFNGESTTITIKGSDNHFAIEQHNEDDNSL